MKSLKALRIVSLIIAILLLGILLAAYFFFDINIVLAVIVYLVFIILMGLALYLINIRRKEEFANIQSTLNASTKLALKEGKIGVIIYDEEYKITFMSEMLESDEADHTGEKLLSWLPELQDVVDGSSERIVVVINDNKYEVSKILNNNALLLKDISKEYDLEKKIKEESYVLGLCNFDNHSYYQDQ